MDAANPFCEVTESTFDEFITNCASTCGEPRIDRARIIVGRGIAGVPSAVQDAITEQGFSNGSETVSCFRVVLTKFSDPDLFTVVQEDCTKDFADDDALIAHLNQKPDTSFYAKTDKEIMDEVPNLTSGLYCVGLESCDFITGILDQRDIMKTSNLHPSTNPNVAVMPGINTSMFYVGGINSCSTVHREDGNAASVAVILDTLDQELRQHPCKLWVGIPDGQKLEQAISCTVRATPSSDDSSSSKVQRGRKKKKSRAKRVRRRRCSRLLHHKTAYVNAKFLDQQGIRYFTFRQYVNDVVYVRPGVHHEVIQLTPNCLEAQNYGDAEWQIVTGHESLCGCDQQDVIAIPRNPLVNVRLLQVPNRNHLCEECGLESANKSDHHRHLREVHKKKIVRVQIRMPKKCPTCGILVKRLSDHLSRPSKKHTDAEARLKAEGVDLNRAPVPVLVCQYCDAIFIDNQGLNGHEIVCAASRDSGPVPVTIPLLGLVMKNHYRVRRFCKKTFHSGELHVHIRVCPQERFKCARGKTFVAKFKLKQHIICDHRDFICDHCKEIFDSKSKLQAHIVKYHVEK
ncbi:hypothetical protein QAD02_003562 [Eretmocerus hayati]|uniref:Uncharacterized protein n=1 Tax=Eretmocerus hayati TaxID=131215 RepID=A0ACC2NNA9_9HYME|nr:hypothetical protein QAD02_003562 [Eretmocerus hayati]